MTTAAASCMDLALMPCLFSFACVFTVRMTFDNFYLLRTRFEHIVYYTVFSMTKSFVKSHSVQEVSGPPSLRTAGGREWLQATPSLSIHYTHLHFQHASWKELRE